MVMTMGMSCDAFGVMRSWPVQLERALCSVGAVLGLLSAGRWLLARALPCVHSSWSDDRLTASQHGNTTFTAELSRFLWHPQPRATSSQHTAQLQRTPRRRHYDASGGWLQLQPPRSNCGEANVGTPRLPFVVLQPPAATVVGASHVCTVGSLFSHVIAISTSYASNSVVQPGRLSLAGSATLAFCPTARLLLSSS